MPLRVLALLPLFLLAACGRGAPELESNGRSVILVSIDSLRADHCSAYGYRAAFAPDLPTTPFLDRMASEGLLCEQGIAATSWTLPSHVSLLTGLGCVEHGVRTRQERMPSSVEPLAERFARAGYATAGFFSGPFLHPVWGFARGFQRYEGVVDYSMSFDSLASEEKGSLREVHGASHTDALCSERVVDAAIDWLGEIEGEGEPFFLFLHLWDPHYDYAPPVELATAYDPDYDGTVDGSDFMAKDKVWEGRDLEHLKALYDAEIRYTDDQLARLWSRVEAMGLADHAVLVITSDHGEEFYEHGHKGHQRTLYEESVRVPMVFWAPDEIPAGSRISAQTGLVDIYPTLLDLCGVEQPSGLTGGSLRPLWEGLRSSNRPLILDLLAPHNGAELRAWRGATLKTVWNLRTGTGESFDLESDPWERNAERLESLQGADTAHIRRSFQAAEAAARTPETMDTPTALQEELDRLGYIGGDQ